MADTNPVIDLAMRYREAVLRRDAAALERLATAYTNIYKDIKVNFELFLAKLPPGQPLTKGQITRMQQYKDLLDAIDRKTVEYNIIAKNEITAEARALMEQASRDAPRLIAAAAGGGKEIQALINTLNPDVIEQLLGFLGDDSPIFKRLDVLTKGRAAGIAETIVDSIAQGMNPKVLADRMTEEFGMILTDSLRQARTVQLYSYREASRANYAANSDIVTGWVWTAELDELTCPACIALHGKVFPIEEPTDAHYNCRCTMVPVTITNPTNELAPGEDWFKDQSEADQRKILGDEKYEAWKEGKVAFNQFATTHKDNVYGDMRGVATLEELGLTEE